MNKSLRCNLEETPDGTLRICWGNHERSAPCEWVEFVPRAQVAELEAALEATVCGWCSCPCCCANAGIVREALGVKP